MIDGLELGARAMIGEDHRPPRFAKWIARHASPPSDEMSSSSAISAMEVRWRRDRPWLTARPKMYWQKRCDRSGHSSRDASAHQHPSGRPDPEIPCGSLARRRAISLRLAAEARSRLSPSSPTMVLGIGSTTAVFSG